MQGEKSHVRRVKCVPVASAEHMRQLSPKVIEALEAVSPGRAAYTAGLALFRAGRLEGLIFKQVEVVEAKP